MTAPRLTRARLAAALAGVLALAALAFVASLLIGAVSGAGGRRLELLDLGAVFADGSESSAAAQIFWLSRLPRALAATVAGAGLAAAGVTFQAVLRNPLAEPFTLGISSGAALGAVVAIRVGLEASLGPSAVPLLAFAGSLASVALVWRLARVGASRPPATLLLAGITLAFVCSAATMLVQYTASFAESYRIVRWMMGGLDWISARDLLRSAVVTAVGLAALLYFARDFNALAAGAEAAASVGVRVELVIGVAYISASLVVGAVIAFAGPIGFVGIIVPHALRALLGPDHRLLLPASMLGGAAFVLVADTVARTVIAPEQLPVGVVTALVGGPFFLGLLVTEKGRARLWS
jgi:ABC-type Fe3+-siderophore transport system permease subunit